MKTTLNKALIQLMHHYGPQDWWPADNDVEMLVGSVLVQNTNWNNVEKALQGIKRPFHCEEILSLSDETFIDIIRPAGFYTRKKDTIRNLLSWYQTHQQHLQHTPTEVIRQQLLNIKGIGKETADCILLYTFKRPVFVVDVYLKRLLDSLAIPYPNDYDGIQKLCTDCLVADVKLYQEIHAVIVEHGKNKAFNILENPQDLVQYSFDAYFSLIRQSAEFEKLHNTYGFITRPAQTNHYHSFVSTIIGQLLNAQSAKTITNRFLTHFPSVQSVLDSDFETIKSMGLTAHKTTAIINLCESIQSQAFSFEAIETMSDEEAIQAISALKGFGRWSAIVILIHTYNRLNLSTYDDLALRKSVMKILGVSSLSRTDFDAFLQQYEPYKSIASILLWQINKIKS